MDGVQFPIEIWKQILCHLDKENLKKCLLVSNEFRETIIKTPQLMRKLPVIFFNDGWEAKMQFVEEFGFFVRSIKFDDCGFKAMSDIRKILLLTPNVESLVFYNCYFIEPHDESQTEGEENHQENVNLNEVQEIFVENQHPPQIAAVSTEPENEDPIELSRLTFLHLDSCNIAEKLVKSLRTCTTLKSFKITFYYQTPVSFFTDFVCQQNNLEELFCVGWSDMVFKSLFKEDISHDRIKFKLKKFTLECELGYHENFSRFLKQQGRYLEELELTCYNINFHYYRLLFSTFHNLRKLTLPTDWFLTDERANDIKNCRIPTLRELEVIGSNDDITTFQTVVDIFPNIEVLRAENIMYFSLHGILEKFHRLRHIKAENFRVETMMFVNLPSLKIIETSYLFPMALSFLWENLAEKCENIEQLIIKDIGHFKLNASIRREIGIIINNLVRFKKLTYCEIISSPQDPMVNGDNGDDGVNIPEIHPANDHPFYKIVIENYPDKQQVIRVSQYFAQHCVEDVNRLKEIFSKCDIIEI